MITLITILLVLCVAVLLFIAYELWQIERRPLPMEREVAAAPVPIPAAIPTSAATPPPFAPAPMARIFKNGALHHVCAVGSADHVEATKEDSGLTVEVS